MANNDYIHNVSGLSAADENGVLLEYGGIAIKVGPVMLATAQHYIDEIPAEERHKLLTSVSATARFRCRLLAPLRHAAINSGWPLSAVNRT